MDRDQAVSSLGLVVLAAGDSRRMGAPKGLLPVGERPLLAWQLDRFQRAGGKSSVVVVGRDHELYRQALPGADMVRNLDPDKGAFSSLLLGLRRIFERPVRGAFVLPIDVPVADLSVWTSLAQPLTGGAAVVRPIHDGRRGHPVALSAAFCAKLMTAPPESRLDHEIRALPPDAIIDVSVDDPSISLNLNDPDAFAAWLRAGLR